MTRKSRTPDERVAALLARHGGSDPRDVVSRLCRDLLRTAEATVPVNLNMLASYRNARVRVTQLPHSEIITWENKHWVIRLRRSDTAGRQRFSLAHAIVHTFFMEASAGGLNNRSRGWSAQEEELCDYGGAELLLPAEPFRAQCPCRPTMDDVLRLAATFQASAEATALRVATLSSVPAAMVVLEPALKPKEFRQLAESQSQPMLPGMPTAPKLSPRLRVQKAAGNGSLFIPRHKSFGEHAALAELLEQDDHVEYSGDTGLIPGRLRISARRMPIIRDGVRVPRVVCLVFDAVEETRPARWSG